MFDRFPPFRAFMRALAALTTIAVCTTVPLASGAAVMAPTATSRLASTQPSGWDPKKPVVYVTITLSNQIQVFDQAGNLKTPLATITDHLVEPIGLFVDQQKNLWVANFGPKYTGYVLEFAPGSATAKGRIDVPAVYGAPTQIFLDRDGTLVIVGCFEQGCDIAKRTPAGKWSNITDSNVALPEGIVGDGLGNVYVSGFSNVQNGAIVEMLPKGQAKWRGIGFPYFAAAGQLAFDYVGRLAIADTSLSVFSFITSLSQLDDAFHCLNCSSIAFDASGTNIWALGSAEPPSLSEYQFPGGAPEKSVQLPVSGASALAVSPAFAPPPPQTAEAARRWRSMRAVR